jgi:hypothetical protein
LARRRLARRRLARRRLARRRLARVGRCGGVRVRCRLLWRYEVAVCGLWVGVRLGEGYFLWVGCVLWLGYVLWLG